MANIEQEIVSYWSEYTESKSTDIKRKLMQKYLWLVKYSIQGVQLPQNALINDQDLLNIGILGLNESIERYDPERGVKFESYAVPRIKGVVKDELRKLDWLSRGARKKAHEFLQAGDMLRSEFGREVTSDEIRKKLNVSEEEYRSYLSAAAAANAAYSMNEVGNSTTIDGEEVNLIEELPDTSQESILNRITQEERVTYIVTYLQKLPEKKRLVVMLYYYESLTFKEIAAALNISEGRVSQIHTETIGELRRKMNEYENA